MPSTTQEDLKELQVLQAKNAQLMQRRKALGDTVNALQGQIQERYCEAQSLQDGILYLWEEILKQVSEPSTDQECERAMTQGDSNRRGNFLPRVLKSESASETNEYGHVPRGAPSHAPDSGENPCEGADALNPETPFSASELAMGNIGLQTAGRATTSRSVIESLAACAAGATGPWTTMHRSGTAASDQYQIPSNPVSLLQQPQHTPNSHRGFPRATQSHTEMRLRPSHTVSTAIALESNPEPAALQTNELTMQQSSQLATTSIPTMQDIDLQDVQAHGSQCAQCNNRNNVDACKPQQHVNVQNAKLEHCLYGSSHSGSIAASSSVRDDHTCSVPADPPQSDTTQSNPNTSTEQLASSRIDPGVTTLVVRNVPARYTKKELLQEWSPNRAFDFFYLPFNHRKKRAAGYCFVNFTSHEEAVTFHNQWHSKCLSASKRTGKKLCIGAAEVQGLEANLQHLMCCGIGRTKNTKYLPSVFNADGEMPFTGKTSSDIPLALQTNRPPVQSVEGSA